MGLSVRHACARAQIFQVRQQDSKGIEHSMYRKTVLTHFEEKRQHPATYGWTYSAVCPAAWRGSPRPRP